MIITTALMCLSLNLYHEARGEPVMGQYAVALVTMNRAKEEEEVCKTVFKKHQFSWTSAVTKSKGGWYIPNHMKPTDQTAWMYATKIAQATLEGRMQDFTRGADHYHANYVRPSWASKMKLVKEIGAHRFYASA